MKDVKISLLIATDTFYPHWTGISKSIFNLTQKLKSNFDITVLTVAREKGISMYEEVFGIKIIRKSALFQISRAYYSISILGAYLSLVKTCDTILINSPSANVLPFALIAKLYGKKLIIFHQGDLILPKGIKNRFYEKIFDFCSYISFGLADKVATYTKDYAMSSRVLKPYLNKFTPVLLPVIVAKPLSVSIPEKKLPSTVYFGFGGRFVEEKGFDILFSAIPIIKKEVPNACFFFAGPKTMEYEDFFSTLAPIYNKSKDSIFFLGLLNEHQLAAFYKEMDFMIFPSRSDCFNLMQAEAMLSGTPCITSNIPGLRFLVHETGFGTLFITENPEDLAKKTVLAIAKRKETMLEYTNVLTVLEDKTNVEKLRNFITN